MSLYDKLWHITGYRVATALSVLIWSYWTTIDHPLLVILLLNWDV